VLTALDPRQLECFIAVAEELNLKRAAMRLFMTQPPLTRRIHRLEQAVGAELFRRTATGMELTDAGSELLTRAYRIVELSRHALESIALAKAGELGPLKVGYHDPAVVAGVPELLGEFVGRHPRIDIRFHLVPKHAQIDYLLDRSLHVAFGRDFVDAPGIIARTVITEDLFVAYRPDVYRIDHRELTPSDLEGLPLVVYPGQRGGFVDELFRRCREAGFTPLVAAEAEDVVATLAYVALGAAIGVVPESATSVHARGVTFKRLREMTPAEVTCIYAADDRSPTLELFVSFLEGRLLGEDTQSGRDPVGPSTAP
jgi:LysR family transcriptional regulator, benzoate and cis,cis-muconate-responsive activator of ben and cat genes